jgi:DNA-binding response OmpR family regulator
MMLKVLIVEDDLVIAELVETLLTAEGYRISGIARTVAEAVALCSRYRPDYAIVDLRLADGGIGTEIIGQIGGVTGVGVMYASDTQGGIPLTAADGIAFLSKPYSPADLLSGLAIVVDIVTKGSSARAHPRGFRVLRPGPTAPVSGPV